MNFYGLQKLTLLDFPQKPLCTLFTGRVQFPMSLCQRPVVTDISRTTSSPAEEISPFSKSGAGCLTGVCDRGEPLLYKELPDFFKKVKELGFAVKIDTNGSFPDRLKSITDGFLCDYVAVDIKNSREKYRMTVGVDNFDFSPIEKTINILNGGSVPFEFRTTVTKEFQEISDIESIAQMIAPAKNYFLQQFKDSGNLIGEGLSPHSPETLDTGVQFIRHIPCTVCPHG